MGFLKLQNDARQLRIERIKVGWYDAGFESAARLAASYLGSTLASLRGRSGPSRDGRAKREG